MIYGYGRISTVAFKLAFISIHGFGCKGCCIAWPGYRWHIVEHQFYVSGGSEFNGGGGRENFKVHCTALCCTQTRRYVQAYLAAEEQSFASGQYVSIDYE